MDIPPSQRAQEHRQVGRAYAIEEEYQAYFTQMVFYPAVRDQLQSDRQFLKRIKEDPQSAEARLYRQQERLYSLFVSDYDGFLDLIAETYKDVCRPALQLAKAHEQEMADIRKEKSEAERDGNSKVAELLSARLRLSERQQQRYLEINAKWQQQDKKTREERALPAKSRGPNGLGAKYHLEIPSDVRDPDTYRLFSRYHIIYSICGLALGFVCIIGGIVLFLNGVVGSTSWTAKILGAESNISDAAPGAVLFIVGLFIILVTRFNIKVKK